MNTKSLAKQTFIQASTAILLVLLAWLVVGNASIILTGFGGILIAVLFCGSASWLSTKTNVSARVWLPVTIIAPVILLSLFFAYTAPKVVTQANELMERIPQAISQLEQQLTELQWTGSLTDAVKDFSTDDSQVSAAVKALSSFFSSTISGLGSFVIAVFLALFLAVNPAWYIDGAIRLVPPAHRSRAREVFKACGSALNGWLLAKLASMIIVGLLTTLGLWALGIDLALILGIIAALLSFIPNLGPVIGFIPAAMVSVISGFDALLYVTLLYIAVQIIESYVLTPVLQAEFADLPPALTLFTQLMMGAMLGMIGILLAAPLIVTLTVIVKMLYVEDLLEATNGDDTAD